MKKITSLLFVGMLIAFSASTSFAALSGTNAATAVKAQAFLKYQVGGVFTTKTKLASTFVDASGNMLPTVATGWFILDTRSNADYQLGHIPGAVNAPFTTAADNANLALYPTNKPILVVCYTGHQASMVTAVLNTLGYDAWALKFGMLSWFSPTGYYQGGVLVTTGVQIYTADNTKRQFITGSASPVYPLTLGPNP